MARHTHASFNLASMGNNSSEDSQGCQCKPVTGLYTHGSQVACTEQLACTEAYVTNSGSDVAALPRCAVACTVYLHYRHTFVSGADIPGFKESQVPRGGKPSLPRVTISLS